MELIDLTQFLRFIAALVFVLALMGGLALAIRKVNGQSAIGKSAKKKRLGIVEILPLEGRRKLVLLRRDDREHLVILGTNGETVIEQAIESPHDNQDFPGKETTDDAADTDS